jgi:4-amino-4-deoxy-L-arabinose transferase-like glycosyltransferase
MEHRRRNRRGDRRGVELRGFSDAGLARQVTAGLGLAALVALTALRLAIAGTVPLAPDEAYYWVWSRALAPGYPDHPPMVALWVRLGTALAGDTPLGIRLLGPLSVAVASLLLADAADRLLPGRRAGLLAAALLNATLLLGVGAVIMTPDTPLLFFWTACLWAISRWLKPSRTQGGGGGEGRGYWWLAIGLFAGLAMASKYTAGFLWLGVALWLLVTPSLRGQLLRPAAWLGALLGGAVFLPVVLWNAEHDWASFSRQGGRVAEWRPANAIRFIGELVGGQIGLVTPLVFILFAAGVALAALLAWRTRDPVWTLLVALTLPATLVFTQHAFGDRVQGNWPAIIYPAAAIAAAGLQAPAWRRLHRPAVALGLAITLIVYLQASFAVLPLPAWLNPIALRLSGWDALAARVAAVRQQQRAEFVAADQYGVAAILALQMPADIPIVGIESRWALFNLPHAALEGRTGILLRSTLRDGVGDRSRWSSIAELGEAERIHDGNTIEAFRLFRVTGKAGPESAALLPRPR